MSKLKLYFSLTKPGVLFGNVLTTIAGFLLASHGFIDPVLALMTILGTTLVIASACVINNYFDRDIDSLMTRTKTRAIPSGKIPGNHAVILSIILGVIGIALLSLYTNFLVVIIGIIGFVDYVWLYAMFSKRKSIHGTLVGSISGAMPIIAGYVAASGTIDAGAIIVFLVLFFWQLPEFYSIAIYRHDEYKAAKVPVMSVVKGIKSTKIQIIVYTILCVFSICLLTIFGYTGDIYLVIMLILGLYWLWIAYQGLSTTDDNKWGRKMFRFSLIILLTFSVLVSLSGILQLP